MTSDTTQSIDSTLAQRGAAYGDFREQGRITQNLKDAMQDSPNWKSLPGYMKEGLDMIQHKISRMLNGDVLYDDNIHDIIGYAKLMQDRMRQDRAERDRKSDTAMSQDTAHHTDTPSSIVEEMRQRLVALGYSGTVLFNQNSNTITIKL